MSNFQFVYLQEAMNQTLDLTNSTLNATNKTNHTINVYNWTANWFTLCNPLEKNNCLY